MGPGQGRSPTEAASAVRINKGRWSSSRKRDVVLRILRGETLDALGRELTVSPAKLAQVWINRPQSAEQKPSKITRKFAVS